MSALVMALVAGLAVGSGPGDVSAEIKEEFLGNGFWQGTFQFIPLGSSELQILNVWIKPGWLFWSESDLATAEVAPCKWVEEGNGKCRTIFGGPFGHHEHCGIYKRVADQLIICVPDCWLEPTRVASRNSEGIFILRPAKPPK